MSPETNTSPTETQSPAAKKENEPALETTAPTEWIVRKSDGRMVVTDF